MPEPAQSERSLMGRGAGQGRGGGTQVPPPPMSSPSSFETVAEGDDRITLALRGDLDLEAGRTLRPGLNQALGSPARAVELDLSGVGFCDCSGLNLLLGLRQRALLLGKAVRIAAGSPASTASWT